MRLETAQSTAADGFNSLWLKGPPSWLAKGWRKCQCGTGLIPCRTMETCEPPRARSLKPALLTFAGISVALGLMVLLQVNSEEKQYFLPVVLLFFVFCIDLVYVAIRCAMRLGRVAGLVIGSALAAFLFTPGFAAGEGGAMILPAWMGLFGTRSGEKMHVMWGGGAAGAISIAFGTFLAGGLVILLLVGGVEMLWKRSHGKRHPDVNR